MTRREVELLIKMRSEAQSALDSLTKGLGETATKGKEAGQALGQTEAAAKRAGDAARQGASFVDLLDGTMARLTGDQQQAALKAEVYSHALEQLGGVSKLTATQQTEMLAAVNQGIGSFEAMGTKVPGHVQAARRELEAVNKTHKDWSATLTQGNRLLGLFGASLSVGAIVSFGKALLDSSDQLVKLSDKTQISIDGIQELQYIAEQSGNTLEQLTSGVSMMQARLAGGDDSAVAALRKLGIEQQAFMALRPEDQFMAIARAIAGVEDEMQRVKLARDLFGRSGAEILPSLISDVDELAEAAPRMSEKAVRAFDDVGDSLARLWARAKAASGEVIASAIDGYSRLGGTLKGVVTGDIQGATDALMDLGTELPKVKAPALDMGEALGIASHEAKDLEKADKDLTKATEANERALAKQREELKRAAEATKKFRDSVKAIDSDGVLWRYYDTLPDLSKRTGEFRDALERLEPSRSFAGVAEQLPTVTANLSQATTEAEDLAAIFPKVVKAFADGEETAKGFNNALDDIFDNLPNLILSAFTGGGDVGRSIGALIGKELGEELADALGGVLTKALGQRLGDALGDSIPIVGELLGSLAGAGLSKLGGWITKAEGRKTNDLRDVFIDAAGGLGELNERAHEAGMTLNALLAAKDQKGLEKAIDDLNTAFAQLDAAVSKYGLTWRDMAGDKVAEGFEGEAKTLLDEYDRLITAGYDPAKVTKGMADAFNALIQDAVDTGQLLPASMQPMIDKLVEMGLVTDETRRKLLGLTEDQVNASSAAIAAMQEQFDALGQEYDSLAQSIAQEAPEEVMGVVEAQTRARMEAIEKERDALQKSMAEAKDQAQTDAEALAQAIKDLFKDPIPITFDWPDMPDRPGVWEGYAPDVQPQEQAAGGIYATGARGVATWFGEGGEPELGGPVDFMARVLSKAMSLTGGRGGGRPVVVQIKLDRRTLGEAMFDILPESLQAGGPL